MVFHDLAHTPLHPVASQHLENDVLGAHPVGESPRELDAQYLGAGKVVGIAGHCHGDVKPTGTDPEHADAGGARGVTVCPQKSLAGNTEPFHMDLVADAVACGAEMESVASCCGLEIAVVVGVLVVRLQDVVVDILHGQFRLNRGDAEGLELEHGHGPGCILQEGLIDPDGDFFARYEPS